MDPHKPQTNLHRLKLAINAGMMRLSSERDKLELVVAARLISSVINDFVVQCESVVQKSTYGSIADDLYAAEMALLGDTPGRISSIIYRTAVDMTEYVRRTVFAGKTVYWRIAMLLSWLESTIESGRLQRLKDGPFHRTLKVLKVDFLDVLAKNDLGHMSEINYAHDERWELLDAFFLSIGIHTHQRARQPAAALQPIVYGRYAHG